MRKSIFTRYISAFLLIIFVSFSILTLIISSMTIQSANEQRKTVAKNTSFYLMEYFNSEALYPDIESYVKDLAKTIQILSKNAEKMTIMIINPEADIIICTDNLYSGKVTDPDVIAAASGMEMSLMYTDMSGLLDRRYGVYVTPLIFINSGTESQGALIVCFSAGEMDALSLNTIRTIVLASLWVMIASFVAIYFISEKIVSPLKAMSIATKKFAAGKFDIKIPVTGTDEVAELATAFNSMADSLANLEYMRSSFLANVSHDLRTPMTAISGFIDGILDGAIPEEKQPYYLNIIAQEIRRLSRLVSQLLDISRLEAGNRKFEKTPFDICEMARIILLSFEAKIDSKKLDVEFIAPEDKLFVFSDKDAINQVLYNICDNAVKFSHDGGKYKIIIEEELSKVKVTVFNEGEGISSEDLPHIFDRFYKSDKSRGLDKTGVGLGLYICKTIMDNLGETIMVESEYGKNCRFIMGITKYKGKHAIKNELTGGEKKI